MGKGVETTSNFKLSIQKIAYVLFALCLFSAGLYILQFNPFELSDAINWLLAVILFFSAGYLHSLDLLISIEDLLDKRIEGINRGIRGVRSDFNSTVRTLEFMYNSNGVSQVRIPTDSLKKVENVVTGSVRMKTITNFLSSKSTVILMEGVKDSKLKNHSHQEKVTYFLANGEIEAQKEGERSQILKRGEVLEVEPNEKREIKFRENSVILATYVPALEQ